MPTLHFEGTDGPLDSREFIEFLRLFRAAYAYSLHDKFLGKTAESIVENQQLAITTFDDVLKEVSQTGRIHAGSKSRTYIKMDFKQSFAFYEPSIFTQSNFVDRASDAQLDALELKFKTIQKQSPLVIACVCCVPALTVAVILSGGKVNLAGLKFELKPLGTGIANLRKALKISKTPKIPDLAKISEQIFKKRRKANNKKPDSPKKNSKK